MNAALQNLKVKIKKNKENTNGGKDGNGKPRKDVRDCRCKHHPQNISYKNENLKCSR